MKFLKFQNLLSTQNLGKSVWQPKTYIDSLTIWMSRLYWKKKKLEFHLTHCSSHIHIFLSLNHQKQIENFRIFIQQKQKRKYTFQKHSSFKSSFYIFKVEHIRSVITLLQQKILCVCYFIWIEKKELIDWSGKVQHGSFTMIASNAHFYSNTF